MAPEFKLPSEDEVRKAYSIPAGDPLRIEMVESLPDPNWVKQVGGFLRETADFFGVPTFLLTAGGIIIAVFFVPYWGPSVKEDIKQAIHYWFGPFQELPYQKQEEVATRYAIVIPNQNTVAENIAMVQTGRFASGTQFYPISGYNG